jgi:PD-(D/E)XK nuclease superfamily protein
MFKVSQSKVNTWRRCRQAYDYKYVEMLEQKKKPRPLKFGSIIHEMVEAEVGGKNPFKVLKNLAIKEEKLFDEEREMYGNIVEDIEYIMTAYFDYWEKRPEHLVYIPVKKKWAEHEFEIEIDKDIIAKGKIDAFAKYKKLKSLVEHKSHKNIPNEEHRWRNLQSVFYIRIADMLGWGSMEGTIWDYIRSKPPTRPEILKSGKLSERALDSLPQVVEDVIKANKLKRDDYKTLIKSQEDNLPSYFQRIYTPANKNVIASVFTEFVATSREMAALHGKSKEKTFGQHCTWCGFRTLCAAELKGHDVDFVKEREFIKDGVKVEDTEEIE